MPGIPKPGQHRGDIMSPEKRSSLMSRIKGKDTEPERIVAAWLASLGYEPERHPKDLPGRPDFVFRDQMLALFVDGDFWHGWRFPSWKEKLAPSWQSKIEANRKRDLRNKRKLRRLGWKVIRLWEHQVRNHPELCVSKITKALG